MTVPTINLEVMLAGWTESHSGGAKLTFWLPDGADMVPGLESEFVNLRESTANMSVARSSSLIEYVVAWCAMNDVRLPAYEREAEAA